jgi:hypothetical protein
MKLKNIIYIVIALVLGWVAYMLMNQEKNQSTLNREYYDFKIEDTASISAFTISDYDNKKVELRRKSTGYWEINNMHRARVDAINNILDMAKRIDLKSPVPKNAKENILKNIAAYYKKITFYNSNKIIKTWYFGTPTKEHDGDYMLLEVDNKKMPEPFIMYIPGHHGYISPRVFTDDKEWRHPEIFAYQMQDLKQVKLINHEQPEVSFTINLLNKNTFELLDYQNKKVTNFDTTTVRAYLLSYKKINFENLNKGILSPWQEDSLAKSQPYYTIAVTNTNNEIKILKVFHKAPTSEQLLTAQEEGIEIKYDVDRTFALLPTGEICLVQFFTFDRILWPIESFTSRSKQSLDKLNSIQKLDN